MTNLTELEDAITTSLATITAHWDALMAPTTGGGTAGPRAPRALITLDDHDPSDADIDRPTIIVALRRLTTDVLNGWSRLVMEDRPVTKALPNGKDVPQMAAFLTRHAEWLSWNDAATDCADELSDLASRITRITVPKRKEWISLGACPIEAEFVPEKGVEVCAGQVRAWPQLQGLTHDEQAHLRLPTCQRCGTEATVEWWQTHMMGNPGASPLVTATDLIAVIAFSLRWVVTHEQIRQWKSRGKIESAGRDAKGRTLYRHTEVIEAVRADVSKQRERKGNVGA